MDGKGSQRATKAIPRFASFKPLERLSLPTPASDYSSKHKRGDLNGNGLGRFQTPALPSPSPETAKRHGSSGSSETQLPNPHCRVGTLFKVDVAGDANNLNYGRSYSNPQYHRAGSRSLLGLRNKYLIDKEEAEGNAIRLSEPYLIAQENRYRPLSDNLRLNDAVLCTKAPSGPHKNPLYHNSADADFLPLAFVSEPTLHRSNTFSDEGRACLAVGGYLSRTGGDPCDRDPDSVAVQAATAERFDDHEQMRSHGPISHEDDTEADSRNQKKVQKRIEFSRRIQANSTDCEAWLALIGIQDELFQSHAIRGGSLQTAKERRSSAEVKVAIYENALKSVSNHKDRERLMLGLMSVGSLIWDANKSVSKWQATLKTYPSSIAIWTNYLGFQQSQFSLFRLEQVIDTFADCLRMLSQARSGVGVEAHAETEIYKVQTYVVLRMTLLLREGGLTELSVAIWQALLEFEFNRPTTLAGKESQTSRHEQDLLSAFEQFWNSEVPRIGEQGAKGWKRYACGQTEVFHYRKESKRMSINTNDRLSTWADMEQKLSLDARTPCRTTDDAKDPYRVVLFSDVQLALFSCPTSSSRRELLDAFLCFCQLPPYLENVGIPSASWSRDPFLCNQIPYEHRSPTSRSNGLNHVPNAPPAFGGDVTGHERSIPNVDGLYSTNPFGFSMIGYRVSLDTLFAVSGSWFSAFGTWAAGRPDLKPVEPGFVHQILNTLVAEGVGGDRLALYLLAFELQTSPSTVRKSAKRLLKMRSSSLLLYNAYGLIEYGLGNTDLADKALLTALSMSKTMDENSERDVILLWRTRAWQLTTSGHTFQALAELLKFSRGIASLEVSDNPTARLRTSQTLAAGRDSMISLNLLTHAVSYVECIIIFSYLCDGCSAPAIYRSLKENLELLKSEQSSTSALEELLRQSAAKLLYSHVISHRPYSPASVRSFLEESIAAFPDNTVFLALYAWSEASSRVDDRVRSILRDVTFADRHGHEQQPSLVTHLFAVHTELNRGISRGSNQNTIRRTFERALQSDCGIHCAGLWKWYFFFELEDLSRAKDVFYRAIRACPWVKSLYLLAFEFLSEVLGERELKGIYDLMVEKELRIHTALEDIPKRTDLGT